MSDSTSSKFDARKLAGELSRNSGVSPAATGSFEVKMVGREAVKKLIERMEDSQSKVPASKLKVK